MNIEYLTQSKDEVNEDNILGKCLEKYFSARKGTYSNVHIITNFIDSTTIEKLESFFSKVSKNSEFNIFIKDENSMSKEDINKLINLGAKIVASKQKIDNKFSWYIFEGKSIANVIITTKKINIDDLYKKDGEFIKISYDLKEKDLVSYKEFKMSLKKYLKPCKKDITTLEIVEENKDEKFDLDIFEIELPSGELLDVSLKDDVKVPEDLAISKTKTKKVDERKKMQEEIKKNEDEIDKTLNNVEDFDFDIDIDEKVQINNDIVDKLNEFEEREISNKKSSENNFANLNYGSGFQELDIEKMLFEQNKAELGFKAPKPIKNEKQKLKNKTVFEPVADRNVWHAEDNSNDNIMKSNIIKPSNDFEIEAFLEDAVTVKKKIIIDSMSKKQSKINTFFLQVNKLNEEKPEIKIPIVARDYAPVFWGWPDNYDLMQDELGKKIKICEVNCKIINVENPELTSIDNVKLYQQEGKNGFCIYSKLLASFEPDENDIIRIMKVNKEDYMFECELIRQDSKEYVIWKQFCIYGVTKNSERKYGFG